MTEIIPLGDLHNRKRTELIQTEENSYIKKPRDFKTEVAFSSFCQKLESLGLPRFSRTATLISEGENCHTESLVENIRTTDSGIDTYYYRAGILLCICYLLGSVDIHSENIIASDDMPVIIDMETLLSGKARGNSEHYTLNQSVMRSHLLCNFILKEDGITDVSGFSGTNCKLKNIPHTENKKFFPWERKDSILSGFAHAYRFLMSEKEAVIQALHLFDGCSFRQLLRPTQTYHTLSEKLRTVSDEEKKEKYAFSLLSVAYERDIDKERLKKTSAVLKEEVRSVLANEIPVFYSKGNSKDLLSGNKTVFPGFLDISPVSYAIQRLSEFSDEDLQRQLGIIRLSVSASTPLTVSKTLNINRGALAEGEYSAKTVAESAIFSLPSVFCSLEQGFSSVSFVSSGFSLYSGLCGVMCMYAALYRKTGNKKYLDFLNRCFENFSAIMLCNSSPIPLSDKTISLGDGVTGMISSLYHIYELTECNSFRQAGINLLKRLTVTKHNFSTDYLNGAGALPVILKKYGIPEAKEICNSLLGDFLNTTPYTTGIAHGASGLALSLSALKSLGLPVSDNDISELITWENSYFSVSDGNWQDLRNLPQTGFMSGWCSGAPGIGAARKEMLVLLKNNNLRSVSENDITAAKEFLGKETPAKRDSLCCGTASRLMAASRLGVHTDRIFNQLSTAEKNGSLRFVHPANTDDINISLMQGFSGAAYALAMYGDPLSGGMLL